MASCHFKIVFLTVAEYPAFELDLILTRVKETK
jgi:hypothetical protein